MQGLWEDICSEEIFQQAWEKVRINMGAPGSDRVSVEEFESNLSGNLELLLNLLRKNEYHPLPALTIQAKKGDDDKRTLNIPTVRDRIVQEAFLLVLQPLFDRDFLNCSYGYRPGMSALKAIARVERNIKKGRRWIVDADIESFFDTVDRNLLMDIFSQKVPDPRIAGAVREAMGTENGKGIPQGSPLSPLLSNIYLHPLDERMVKGEWNYVRFADDFVTLCRSSGEAGEAINAARDVLQNQLLLAINEAKTQICRADSGFVFLGYRFTDKGKSPAGKAVEKLKRKVQKEILASETMPEGELENRLKSIIRGWQSYFKLETQDRAELMSQLDDIISSQTDNVPAHVLKAALCIEGGEREKAVEIVTRGAELPSEDPEVRYQWGMLYDALDMPAQARDEYYSTIKDAPGHKGAAYSLGLSYLQNGQVEEAIRFLEKAVQSDPDFAEAHFALGTALENWGLEGAARKAFSRAKELNPAVKLPELSAKDEESKGPVPHSEEDAQLFLQIFSGREGVFARQWVNATGRNGYTPVSEPLSEEDVEAHLAGQETLGLYMMRSDNTVNLGVIDVDITKAIIKEIGADEEKLDEWNRIVGQDINKLVQVFRSINIPVYVENSGRKGRHCWLFLEEPLRAGQVRKFLKEVCKAAGGHPAGLHREVFPKQGKVSKEALGCLIKLPMGVHKVTERRCLFVDDSGKPYHDQMEMLHQVKPVSKETLRNALTKLEHGQESMPEVEIDDTIPKIILEKCNVLKYLSTKAEGSDDLTHYERLIVLCTLGHLGPAGQHYVHRIISHCSNYNRRVTEKWVRRLKPFPMSCPKIREIMCDITPSIGCYCKFPKRKGSYPAPILHADPDAVVKLKAAEAAKPSRPVVKREDPPTKKQAEAKPVEKPKAQREATSIDQALREYLELKKSTREMEIKLGQVEARLESVFQAAGGERVQTYLGQLTRSETDGHTTWNISI